LVGAANYTRSLCSLVRLLRALTVTAAWTPQPPSTDIFSTASRVCRRANDVGWSAITLADSGRGLEVPGFQGGDCFLQRGALVGAISNGEQLLVSGDREIDGIIVVLGAG